jgi:hypothetical protein
MSLAGQSFQTIRATLAAAEPAARSTLAFAMMEQSAATTAAARSARPAVAEFAEQSRATADPARITNPGAAAAAARAADAATRPAAEMAEDLVLQVAKMRVNATDPAARLAAE